MIEDYDEPGLTGQVAGIIAMMSALLKALPPTARQRLQKQMHAEFESLLAVMSTSNGPDGQADLNSVEWIRDLFLKKIEQLDSKPAARRIRKATVNHPRGPATKPVVQRPVSADVDLEL